LHNFLGLIINWLALIDIDRGIEPHQSAEQKQGAHSNAPPVGLNKKSRSKIVNQKGHIATQCLAISLPDSLLVYIQIKVSVLPVKVLRFQYSTKNPCQQGISLFFTLYFVSKLC